MTTKPDGSMAEPDIPDEETLKQEVEVVANVLHDSIQQKSSKETACFLNSLPDYILKRLFPTSSRYQDVNNCHGNHNQADDILAPVRDFLPMVCEKGDVGLVLVLLNFGADPCIKGEKGSPLALATLNNHRPIIERLISWNKGLIEDASEVKLCLAKACEGGHSDLVTFWLDHLRTICGRGISGGDFKPENDPLTAACKGGHFEIAANLLQDGISNISRETPISAREALANVLDVWVEEDNSHDSTHAQKLLAKWTKKNIQIFDQRWLQVPRYTGTLKSIDLSHNALTTIPGLLLWGLPWLEKLTITHNALNKIPPPTSVGQLDILCLKSLTLSNNHLKSVPPEIFMLPKLEHLSLADNQIQSINPAHIGLSFTPEEGQSVWNCSNLKRLILSNNQLLKIPPDIGVARQLKKLDVSNNKLKEVPAPWDCPLQELYLQNNSIIDVPDMHACWHKTLKYLNLGHNKLAEIPWTICRLQCLLDLKLHHNNIWRLPSINEWGIYHLQHLNLSNNLLVHIDLMKSRSMSTVSSSSQSSTDETRNRLTSTTSDAGRARTPSVPNISNSNPHQSKDKPPTPTENIAANSSNFFIGLDEEVQMLLFPSSFNKSLQTLDLSNNQLQAVPDSVCDMQSLQSLDLHGNGGLTHLPEKLALLKDLYTLKLDPDQICHPREVASIMQQEERPTMKILQLLLEKLHHSQPYRGLKMMIVGPEKCGKTSLLCCLTSSDWPEHDKGVNIKDWRLSNSLTSDTRNSLGLRLFKKPSQDEDDISFTIWDLKGGDTYSVIHQTLFTPHTLYLLVWDVRDKEAGIRKLNPWILNIQAQAPESTIITVGTHLDKLPSKSEQRQQITESLHQAFRQAYPRLRESCVTHKSFVEVQATSFNAAGIRELKEVIYNCASSMTFQRKKQMEDFLIGRKVPQAFTSLRERVIKELANRKSAYPPIPPIMTEAQLTNHIRTLTECNMNSAQDLEEAVEFLRDTGSLVHVSDHTYGLTNLFFLDPAWLCSVLLDVVKLKDKTHNISDGMVTKKTLCELCEESGFGRDRFDEYIQLLARFEIALPASSNRFLLPSLLPKVAPVIEHTRYPLCNHKLERWYKMAYIPPGFWSRLVSRMMVNIRHMDDKLAGKGRALSMRKPSHGSLHLRQTHTTVWQEGMFVQYDAGQIKVEPMQFPNGNKPGIKVTVRCQQGTFKAMGFVVDHIETLLSEWYPGLDDQNHDTGEPLVERLVPCPVCDEQALENEDPYTPRNAFEDVHIFKLKQLVVLATLRAQDNVQCPLHEDILSLKQLLPDVFMVDLSVSYLMEEKLDCDRRLGVGGFGEVFKAEYDGQTVALKKLLKNQQDSLPMCLLTDQDQSFLQEEQEISVIYKFPLLRSEVAMMSRLKHPCIIKLIGVSIQQLSFAMEFAPLGDLDSYVGRKAKELSSKFASERTVHRTILPRMLTYKITHQVAMAIRYLHRMRIIHTDLKTDNVLLCSIDPLDRVNVKLADYGISHVLFAGGVKGTAGFHTFCAPEILKGKAFDEKVDWFSFGMFIYHLMTGLLPFHDLQSSIEAKAMVTSGDRPKLAFPDYTILPRFAHLEGLMKWCWKDSPADRPEKEEVLHSMRDASFLCLRHCIELESDVINCLYSPTSSQTEEDELRQYRMWLWKGHAEGRSYTKFNIEHSAQMRPKECPGKAVTCALQVGQFHVLGTINNEIEVYGVQGTGRQLFTHLQDLRVAAKVTSLFYIPRHTKEVQLRTIGYLFAGLEDGTVVIFAHSNPQYTKAAFDLMQLKLLTLSTEPKPCLCMQLVPEQNNLWVSCGNTIRILCTHDLLLDPTIITAAPGPTQLVKGLVCRGEEVWCFIQDSFQVIQYNARTFAWVDTLQCGSLTPSKEQCLSNPVAAKHPLQKEVSFEDPVEDETDSCGDQDNINGSADTSVPEVDGLVFHEDHFEKPAQSLMSGKRSKAKTLPAGGIGSRRPALRRSRPFSDSRIPSTSVPMFSKVTSLLVVKDTLWIGRDTGDIVVVNIEKESPYGHRFGEVLAILSVQSFLGWPHGAIKQLLPVGSNRVVACRNFTSSDMQLMHQLLVWENWGSEQFHEFEDVHYALELAKKDYRNP